MISAAPVDLLAYRGTPFIDVTTFEDINYAGATFVMEIRRFRDEPGAALVTLGNAASNAQGVSVSVISGDSNVQIRINETTIEALQMSSPRGDNVDFYYALDITGGGHEKSRRMRGKFTVEASANG